MDKTAEAILRATAEKGMSRDELAFQSKVSISTLNKMLAGHRPWSFEAMVKIGGVLGVDLLRASEEVPRQQIAPESLGAYVRPAVRWMEGRYVAIRHAFQSHGALIADAVAIQWDDDQSCLAFSRADNFEGPIVQRGRVSFSMQTGHSYLVSSEMGRFDLTVLGRPAEGGHLHGICTTTYLRRGAPTPASSATTLLPVPVGVTPSDCGPIAPDHPVFVRYSRLLGDAEANGFARLVSLTG